MNDVYKSIRSYTKEEAKALLLADDLGELQYLSVGAGMYSDDLLWAQDVCLSLAQHHAVFVRGNALLGLAHLARRFRTLDLKAVMPVVDAAKDDAEEYVRFQANDAWDDIQHYCLSQDTGPN